MFSQFLPYIITAILGGGVFKGIESLVRALTESKEKKVLADNLDARTPSEIESVSVATMKIALESAQSRITALEHERAQDREYYQGRIHELNEQLVHVRTEMEEMSKKMAALLLEVNAPINKKGG